MIIIFGTKMLKKHVKTFSNYDCAICHYESATLLSTWRWFTLFWLPIFPVGKKKYWLICSKCQNGYALTKEKAIEIQG